MVLVAIHSVLAKPLQVLATAAYRYEVSAYAPIGPHPFPALNPGQVRKAPAVQSSSPELTARGYHEAYSSEQSYTPPRLPTTTAPPCRIGLLEHSETSRTPPRQTPSRTHSRNKRRSPSRMVPRTLNLRFPKTFIKETMSGQERNSTNPNHSSKRSHSHILSARRNRPHTSTSLSTLLALSSTMASSFSAMDGLAVSSSLAHREILTCSSSSASPQFQRQQDAAAPRRCSVCRPATHTHLDTWNPWLTCYS